MAKQKIVCFVGPSGVGKTEISVDMAKVFNAEIISADSMQIYKDMNIGTAKITETEKQGIPHHLINIISPKERFSVYDWQTMAKQKIEEISSRSKNVFIVGGTGLYVKSLIYGYNYFGASDRNSDNQYEEYFKVNGKQVLWELLNSKNAELASKVHPNKDRTVIRYLQIVDGKESNLELQKEKQYDCLLVGLTANRETLYERTNLRVDKMINAGLTIEVKNLFEKYQLLSTDQSALAIGYREYFDYFNGNQTLEHTIELIKQHSRNYVKRQLTFFNKMDDIIWFNREDKNQINDTISKFLEG